MSIPNPFSDYIIPATDPRFIRTYAQWIHHMLIAMAMTPYIDTVNERLEINLSLRKTGSAATAIRRDIKSAIEVLESTHADTIIFCYDSIGYPYENIRLILDQIDSKRRRLDYNLGVMTGFCLSNLLDSTSCELTGYSLIDNPIPSVNCLLINYVGTKLLVGL